MTGQGTPRFPWWAVLALVGVLLAPSLVDPLGSFAGRAWMDGYGTQWHHWFYAEWLAGRTPLDPTPLLFFPWGKSMVAHTGANLLDAALAWPLRAAAGPVLGSTLFVALLLFGNAWGAWKLARALGADRGAWLAALLAPLLPYALEELQLGRCTQAILVFPALFLSTSLALDRPWRPALAGLWFALSALTYWYYGLLLALLWAALLVVALLRGPDRVRTAWRSVLALVVASALLLPAAWPLLEALQAESVPGLLALGEGPIASLMLRTVEGDPEGLYVLAPLSGRTGALILDEGHRFVAGTRVLGPVQWVLLFLGVLAARRRRALLVAWILVCAVVATGPVLVVGGGYLPNPPYAALLEHSAVMRRWWWPGRAVACLSLLGIAGGAVALSRVPGARLRALLGAGVVLGLFLTSRQQDLVPLARWRAERSPGLACLATAPDGGVIDLPANTGQRNLYLQTLHGKPLLGGMPSTKAAFAPADHRRLLDDNAFLAQLHGVGNQVSAQSASVEAPGRDALLELGFRYVLVQISAYERESPRTGGMVSDWSRTKRRLTPLLGSPAYEDERLALYGLAASEPRCALE